MGGCEIESRARGGGNEVFDDNLRQDREGQSRERRERVRLDGCVGWRWEVLAHLSEGARCGREREGRKKQSSKRGRASLCCVGLTYVFLLSFSLLLQPATMSTSTFFSSQPLPYRRRSLSTSSSSQQPKSVCSSSSQRTTVVDHVGLISPPQNQQHRDTQMAKGGEDEQLTPPRSGDEHDRENGEYRGW